MHFEPAIQDPGSYSAWTVPTAFYTVDNFFFQLLPFLLFGCVVVSLLPGWVVVRVEHFAALCVPHLIVEIAGICQELCVGPTFCHFTLQNKGRKSGMHIPTPLGTDQPRDHSSTVWIRAVINEEELEKARIDLCGHCQLQTRSCALFRLQVPFVHLDKI